MHKSFLNFILSNKGVFIIFQKNECPGMHYAYNNIIFTG